MADTPARLPYFETFRDQAASFAASTRQDQQEEDCPAAAPGTPEFMVAYRKALVELAWLPPWKRLRNEGARCTADGVRGGNSPK